MHVSLPKLPALALVPLACVDGPFTCHISVSILSQVHKFVSTYICGENALLFYPYLVWQSMPPPVVCVLE